MTDEIQRAKEEFGRILDTYLANNADEEIDKSNEFVSAEEASTKSIREYERSMRTRATMLCATNSKPAVPDAYWDLINQSEASGSHSRRGKKILFLFPCHRSVLILVMKKSLARTPVDLQNQAVVTTARKVSRAPLLRSSLTRFSLMQFSCPYYCCAQGCFRNSSDGRKRPQLFLQRLVSSTLLMAFRPSSHHR